MASKPNNKIFLNIFTSKVNNGFTLIELLVTVIILGILAAVAIPNFIAQIGKGREAEAKVNLASLARAQQAYHLETKTFFNGSDLSSFADVNLSSSYYLFTADTSADANQALHTAYSPNPVDLGVRDFAVGVYYNSSLFTQTFCVASGIDSDGTNSSVTAQADETCSGGSKIK
jgi:prepilin-type N-terminal cleavage/methylation domain-containing protein